MQDGITYVISATLPLGGPLLGVTQRTAVDGTANFTGLSITSSCGSIDAVSPLSDCYSIMFSSTMFNTTTRTFSVWAGRAVEMAFLEQPVHTSVGVPVGKPSVHLEDVYGNPIVRVPVGYVSDISICADAVSLEPTAVTPHFAGEQLLGDVMLLGGGSRR